MKGSLALYIGLAVCTSIGISLGADDAVKYINPKTLWILKTCNSTVGAALLAAKMFISTTFAEYKASKNGNGNGNGNGHTDFLTKPQTDNQTKTPTP